MTFILGLTGGIASGKSLVTNYFLQQKIPVVDADIVARKVVAPKTPTLEGLVAAFGVEILQADGQLNRSALGAIVFHDDAALTRLNQLMDGAIRQEILTAIAQAKKQELPLLVLDIPLLYESHYDQYCDSVMVVNVSLATQVTRLMQRNNLSATEAHNRIQKQMPLASKVAKGDVVIDNNGTPQATYQQVERWLAHQNFKRE